MIFLWNDLLYRREVLTCVLSFNSLTTFAKMLTIKSSIVTPDRPKASLREKLLLKNRDLEDISPLVVSKDGSIVRKARDSPSKTPNSKRTKTVASNDKENVQVVSLKEVLGARLVASFHASSCSDEGIRLDRPKRWILIIFSPTGHSHPTHALGTNNIFIQGAT